MIFSILGKLLIFFLILGKLFVCAILFYFFKKRKFSKELIKFNDARKPGTSKSLEGSKMKVQDFSRIFQTLFFTETRIHLSRFWIGSFSVEFVISQER